MINGLLRYLTNRSITLKLIVSFGLILLILGVAVFANLLTQQQENAAREDLLQARRKLELLQDLHLSVIAAGGLQGEAIANAFANRPDEASRAFSEMDETIHGAYDTLDVLAGNGDGDALLDSVSVADIRASLEGVESGLARIQQLYLDERGFGEDSLQAQLVALATQIHELASEDAVLYDSGLQIELSARGYVFATNTQIITQFNSARLALQRDVDTSELSERDQVRLAALLDEAFALLQDIIAADLGMLAESDTLGDHYERLNSPVMATLIDQAATEIDEANERLEQVQDTGLIIQLGLLIGALALGLLLAVIVSTNISTPVQKLENATTRIAAGAYEERIGFQRGDEVGRLAQSFNRMADAVQARERKLGETAKSLRQANKQLIEASVLKDQFMSTMSHELRTPLNAIIGYTGLLQMGIGGTVDEPALEKIASIEQSGEHLLAIINDILDISKIEAGRLEIVAKPIELKGLIAVWAQQIQVMAEKKKLAFEHHLGDGLPEFIQGDSDRLTQIAMNLLSNAVKFTDEGQVTLRVSATNSVADAAWTIEVTDTGRGISSEAQEYIFDEFRQVDGTYSREYGGTGLGLSIVRRLTKLMDGKVTVKSTLGSGSTFTVELPLQVVEREAALET